MIQRKLITDETAITVAIETIIFFGISIIFMGMIFLSFQGLNQKQSNLLMEEQLEQIGNGIAKKMSDMAVEARRSYSRGSHTFIESDFWIPDKIVDDTYSIKLTGNKILLESTTGKYVRVEVPIDSNINLAQNSTIYSMDESFGIKYDSATHVMLFSDGGVKPFPDLNPPTISIVSPPSGTIGNIAHINVSVWDDTEVTHVEYYVNKTFKYSVTSPFNWSWNTRTMNDGDYTVTAVAYDVAGNAKADIRNYHIYNPSLPPEITVISPPNGSSTDFRRPAIKAQISDDKGINFSSIMLLVDGYNQKSNATFNNVSSKLTTITYIPAKDMNKSVHSVKLQVKDIETPMVNLAFANWSFEVTNVSDGASPAAPTASIISPISNAYLVPGSAISISYLASDAGSGLDNLTINVTRNDGISYLRYETISVYPSIVYDITPQGVWIFNQSYVGGKNYTYRITAYDRSGNSINQMVGPFTVSLPGQDSQLEVNTATNTTTGKFIKNIMLRDNVSDNVFPKIMKIKVSWITNSTETITKIALGGNRWTGSSSSGTELPFASPYTFSNTKFQAMDLTFSTNIGGKTINIIFYLGDGTTRMVTFAV
jgi:hypothetical protein